MPGFRLEALRVAPQLRNVPQPKKPDKKRGLIVRAGLGIARPILAGLGEVGEALSAPVMALSEGYGAFEAGKPVLPAAYRGFTEPTEKKRYPTFGERIVPPEEGEGLGRKAARLGAEILTDPTTYVGPGLVKAAGKGFVVGGKALLGTAVAKGLGKSAAAQTLGRALLPTTTNVRLFGKAPRLAKSLERVEEAVADVAGREARVFSDALKKYGLTGGGKKQVARRRAVTEVIESGTPHPTDKAVNEMAQFVAERFQRGGAETETYRDILGKGIEVARPMRPWERKILKQYAKDTKLSMKNAYAELVRHGTFGQGKYLGKKMGRLWATAPFEMLGARTGGIRGGASYVPQYLAEEYAKKAATRAGLNQSAKNLARQFGITVEEAGQMLKEQTGRIKRAGHIEYGRQVQIPKQLLERDIARIFPRYVSETARRKAIGTEFGLDMSLFKRQMQDAVTAGLDKKTARMVRNALQAKYVESAFGLEGISPTLLGLQTVTKMGPLSTISQISQSANTIVREGLTNFVRGAWSISRDPALRQRALEGVAGQIQSQMEHLIGRSGGRELLGRYGAGKYLRATGFTSGDQLSRVLAYGAGRASMISKAKRGILTPEMVQFGMTQADLANAARGVFSPALEARIGEAASKASQFTTRWTDLPPLWQTPEMKLMTQFKSFIHQQTRFLLRDVMQPAAKYFETGGKEGSIGPLSRALIAYPVAGQGVAALRDLLAEQAANLTGAKRRKPRKFDYNHPVAQMLEDSLYVGAFGLGGDVLQQAARGRLLPWTLGPTISDVAENVEFVARHGAKGELPSGEALLSRGFRHMPGRRILPLEPQEFVGAAQRGFRVLKRRLGE